MIDKLDELIKVTKESGNKPVSLDSILMTSHFKQNGLVK